jgi:hypothetical protein
MKKVTIISGEQGTGKTLKAHEMTVGKNVFEADNLKDALTRMPSDTDVIILDLAFGSDILGAIRVNQMV